MKKAAVTKILRNFHEIAEAMSIEFAEYIATKGCPLAPNKGRWQTYEGKRELTTKEFYKEFLEHVAKQIIN